MWEHGIRGHYRSEIYPKPSAAKKFAKRLGISTSNTSWPRTRSKPFSPEADRLIDCDGGNGDARSDVEEDDGDSFELGPLDGYYEGDRFSDMGNDMWVPFMTNSLP